MTIWEDHEVMRFEFSENEWISANDRHNRWEKARRTKLVRHKIKMLALAALRTGKLSKYDEPVQVYYRVAIDSRRRFDAPNAHPTCKAIEDGFSDAGVWSDDSSQYVTATTFGRASELAPKKLHVVEVCLVPESSSAYVPF